MQWYYTSGGEQKGPVDDRGLALLAQQGGLKPEDYVWNETMGDEWKPASTIPSLFAASTPEPPAQDVPPPLPAAGGMPLAREVSCTRPVGIAWETMVNMLFRPFDIGKWFALGLVVWLAGLAPDFSQAPSAQGRGSLGNWQDGQDAPDMEQVFGVIEGWLQTSREFIQQHHSVITACVSVGIVVVLAWWVFMLWLQSRMRFVFLDDVVNDATAIKAPWSVFAQHGNSLFRWRLGFGFIRLLAFGVLAAVTVGLVILPIVRTRSIGVAMGGMTLSGLLWLVYSVGFGYVTRFLDDFVVPIMYKRDLTTTEGWQVFFQQMWHGNAWPLLVYGAFYVLISIGATVGVALIGMLACCIGCCLLPTPYIGAVASLPIPVLLRLYSLEYLRQFGAEFDLAPAESGPSA